VSENWYTDNPLIHRDRQLKHHDSEWVRRFSCCDLKPLIICRGPIRKEAMDVFDEMGIHGYGILLSEKDSITYSYALAPELRKLTAPDRVHRVPDYSGASKEERVARIQQIIAIARDNGYDSIFAGYGFMAEDEEMVKSMEKAGLNFIGPCSHTQRSAGLKDEAKRTALEVGVSVTPGVDNATALTLLRKSPDRQALQSLVVERGLEVDDAVWADASITLEQLSVTVLAASYAAGIDLYSVEELSSELEQLVAQMFEQYPDNRIRLKAIAGGGGKGQRILPAATSYADDDLTQQIAQAAARVPELVREILAEVKTNGVGDNKNILAEMNIETTRHQEIQVVGNGDWCITMGGRDCSLQMHEQKLLEVSVTQEELGEAITAAEQAGKPEEAASLQRDLGILEKMELEAADFGAAVGLDSVATFECIVDGSDHFFMEMNTRIQVEHRVTELCYALKFVNPDDPGDSFVANSLVEVMVLLACHGKRLPCPQRVLRETTALEARLNATNAALQPHAGGIIKHWSTTVEGEIRDDQGISLRNPDTGVFMDYHLAGAYDSNIALLLTVGVDRLNTYQRMSQLLRMTKMGGINLATNLEFHYGLVQWFIGAGINARPTTAFIVPYLTLVGLLKQTTDQLDPAFSYVRIRKAYLDGAADAAAAAKLAEVIDIKETLITRAIADVFERPHLLAGWLSTRREQFTVREGKVEWLENPLVVLAETYHFLNMDYIDGAPALYQIWKNDDELMQEALAFYGDLEARTGVTDWPEMRALLEEGASAPDDLADVWPEVLAAHTGFQAGMEVLSLLPYVADKVDYFALTVNPDLTITIPERLQDKALQSDMAKVLAPPPVAKSDEIVAISGGMFYPREAPGMDIYVEEGSHFEEGDPLYIVEVMKMFNKVYAPFAGTIKKALVDGDGVIIKKGQPLFIVAPDIEIESRVPEDDIACMREATREFLATQD
jgi:acetyl/propionyl-CoA carboxylase alpha subunit